MRRTRPIGPGDSQDFKILLAFGPEGFESIKYTPNKSIKLNNLKRTVSRLIGFYVRYQILFILTGTND